MARLPNAEQPKGAARVTPISMHWVFNFMLWSTVLIPASAASASPSPPHSSVEICRLIGKEADARKIPSGFFARLIWQESRFNGAAVSPKGALGIAQFMPATAAERALRDPFHVSSSLAESAAFLEELAARFGNWGLAAAAYNAGPERVRRWLAGQATLPSETRNYVQNITGLAADTWKGGKGVAKDFALHAQLSFEEACVQLASRTPSRKSAASAPVTREEVPSQPWGMQVASHTSRETALAVYGRLQRRFSRLLGNKKPLVLQHRTPARTGQPLYAVRIGADNRAAAERLCSQLRSAGGLCWVMRN